jgi:hypothetical protein
MTRDSADSAIHPNGPKPAELEPARHRSERFPILLASDAELAGAALGPSSAKLSSLASSASC